MLTNPSSRNMLLHSSSDNLHKDLFRIAYHFAANGRKVWFVTAKKLDGLPLDETDDDYLAIKIDVLRNVYFKYIDEPRALIDEIFQLHMYRGTMPSIILIDYLHTFFDAPDMNDNDFMQKHMLIAASLHSSVESLTKCLKWDCYSVLCVDTTANLLYDRFKQIFVDSYFSRPSDIFTSSRQLLEELKAALP